MKINDILLEFASGGSGDSGNYFKELASAWYNGTFDSGSLQKGIKSQQDVERLLQRGIVCPDGVTRKFGIDYNSDFDGVVISSDDYYEHADHDETDSRTGKPFGPYDYMEFGDEELDESAQWRDPKYKGQLYTQEPPDYNDTREYDNAMFNPKPDDYPGRKELPGGGEYDRTDPLVRGAGIGRSGIKNNILDRGKRKGLPSRDQITSLKQSIKDISGRHTRANLPKESVNEFVTPQAVAQDPGLEREKDVDVIFFGRPGKDYNAEDAWAALEEVLPAEYPPGSERAQYKVAEVAKSGGAVITNKPLSVAKQLVATFNGYGIRSRINGNLREFAADDGDSGGEDDALHKYARMWWAGDEATQQQIEKVLARMGWEIGEDEGGYDNGGVFVVRAGDVNGDSYTSWAAEDLTESGLNEKSTSQAQFRTMAAAAHNPEFARKVGIKPSVAREFNRADKGQDYKSLPTKATEGAPVTTTPGSVDPGGAVDNFKQQMANNTQRDMAEGNRKPEPPEADYGDDYQQMVLRLKKLAGAGPLKTVYDPNKRVYRNMPTAVQPKK